MIEEDAAAANDLRLTVNAEGVKIGRLLGVARRIENPGIGRGTGEEMVGHLREEVHPTENPGVQGEVHHLVVEDTREMVHPRAGDVVDLGLQNLPRNAVPRDVVHGVLSAMVLANDAAVAGHPYVA